MKKFLTILAIASSIFLTGCVSKTPLTDDQKIYAGKWVSNDGTWFQIYNNGGGDFKKSNSSVTGGATNFTETGFEIGLFGLSSEFVIDKEPTIVDERLIMQVNGDMYLNVTPKILETKSLDSNE